VHSIWAKSAFNCPDLTCSNVRSAPHWDHFYFSSHVANQVGAVKSLLKVQSAPDHCETKSASIIKAQHQPTPTVRSRTRSVFSLSIFFTTRPICMSRAQGGGVEIHTTAARSHRARKKVACPNVM
jgi:hypothetical protein